MTTPTGLPTHGMSQQEFMQHIHDTTLRFKTEPRNVSCPQRCASYQRQLNTATYADLERTAFATSCMAHGEDAIQRQTAFLNNWAQSRNFCCWAASLNQAPIMSRMIQVWAWFKS